MVMAARTGLSGAAGLGIPEKRLAQLLCGKFVDDNAGRIRDRRSFAQWRDGQVRRRNRSSKLIDRVVAVGGMQIDRTAPEIDRKSTGCNCYPKSIISIGNPALRQRLLLAICTHGSPSFVSYLSGLLWYRSQNGSFADFGRIMLDHRLIVQTIGLRYALSLAELVLGSRPYRRLTFPMVGCAGLCR